MEFNVNSFQSKQDVLGNKVNYNPKLSIHKKGAFFYHSLLRARESKGETLEEFKANKSNIKKLAILAADYLNTIYKITDDIVIITAPKRSYTKKLGYHFATLLCREISKYTKIKFVEDVFISYNYDPFHPDFKMEKTITENNIILIDDIVTTGQTITTCYNFISEKNVFILLIINNN